MNKKKAVKYSKDFIIADAKDGDLAMGITTPGPIRNSKGEINTSQLRLSMQKTMQSKCAVFRTEKTLKEGVEEIRKPFDGLEDISIKDKSLLFNTDLDSLPLKSDKDLNLPFFSLSFTRLETASLPTLLIPDSA